MLINVHIISELLIQHPIDIFGHQFVSEMLYEKRIYSHLSKQMFLKTCHKIGTSIT